MLQTGLTSSDGTVGPALAAAVAAWARVPSLAPALTGSEGLYLVLDAGDGRVLYASEAARPLADALAASGGAMRAREIARAAPREAAPRLARLRLDPRRIAPPALCLLARGTTEAGEAIVLLVPAAPVTLPRPRPARSERTAADAPPDCPLNSGPPNTEPLHGEPDAPKCGDRFLWRSDASGTLTALTGAGGLARLVGTGWAALAEARRLSGADAILAALAERRTFRAAPASLDLGAGPIAMELSGAPLGRGDAAFSGFGGFGVIRGLPAVTEPDRPPPIPRPEPETPAAIPPDSILSVSIPPGSIAPPQAVAPETEPTARDATPASAPTEAALSNDEHAAFREIARALGARYAGDDEAGGTGGTGGATPRPAGGAVMPFPGHPPEHSAPPPPAAETPPREMPASAAAGDPGILSGLPLPALVHRGPAILAANPPLLGLTGFADLAALNEAGIGRLFRGLPPDDAGPASARETTIEAADGQARPVEVLRGACTWDGAPAACLILRPLADDDAGQALVAERLARAAQAARATGAEAALDAVAAGVVTVDRTGRIVALNRAAAGLFGGDPREVVGAGFVGLFDARSALAVAEALHGTAETVRAVPVSTSGRDMTLSLAPARADGRRVAVLEAAPVEVPVEVSAAAPDVALAVPAPAVEDRKRFLARLDRALRGPAAGIVDLTGAMLEEPFGPVDPRYRACLAEIKASGEGMLERVGALLDLAAVEAGTLTLEPRPLALNDVVAGCVARLQPEAVRGRIVLRTSFSADLGELEADEPSMRRAASLVIEHAIRRSAAGGQVIVSTGAAGGAAEGTAAGARVALRVRDTGSGRPDANAASPGDPGDGLALPRALVEANGGCLNLASRADADGTLVEIILPARRIAGA